MKKLVLGALLCLMFNQCEKLKYMNEKKYDWLVYTTEDKGYPMDIVDGWFTYENGEYTSIPAFIRRNTGLILDSGTMIIGEDLRPVPVEMEIYWFSLTENKFFKGKFKLDKEKMTQLFEKAEKMDRGGDLKVAPIPGGRVILYFISSTNVILGVYQGEEYFVKGDEAFRREVGQPMHSTRTREEYLKIFSYPKHVQEEIKSGKINYQLWDNIMKKYPWRFRIEYEVPLYMVNGEMVLGAFIDGTDYGPHENTEVMTSYLPKSVPYRVGEKFNTRPDGRGMEMVYRIYLGHVNGDYDFPYLKYEDYRKREQELVKIFADFYEKIGRTEFELVLKLKDGFVPKGLYLKKGDIEQLIPDVYIEAYNDTFNKILLEGVPKQ